MNDKDYNFLKFVLFVVIAFFVVMETLRVTKDIAIANKTPKVEIDSVSVKSQEVIEEIKVIEHERDERILQVRSLDNDSSLLLFYKLVKE